MFFATPVKFFSSLIESPLVNISSVSVTKLVDVERKIQDGYDGFLHLSTCPRSHGHVVGAAVCESRGPGFDSSSIQMVSFIS